MCMSTQCIWCRCSILQVLQTPPIFLSDICTYPGKFQYVYVFVKHLEKKLPYNWILRTSKRMWYQNCKFNFYFCMLYAQWGKQGGESFFKDVLEFCIWFFIKIMKVQMVRVGLSRRSEKSGKSRFSK